MKDALRSLELGNSVAEHDAALEKYFVENEAFHALVDGKVDVIAGDKGTGKTALYRIIKKRHREISKIQSVEIISGFNPAGSPIFQRLVQEEPLTEGQYISVWKTYILSLIGNWLLGIVDADTSDTLKSLDQLLESSGLRSPDDKPETIFNKVTNKLRQLLHPKSAEVQIQFSETGIPIINPKLTFGASSQNTEEEIRHEDALQLLNKALGEIGLQAWVALDRLDEAFQGFPDIEVPALRALLRTYLDLLAFENFRLKLFVRKDLFRKIIGEKFVNLTHINARKIEIVWDESDLLNLLCERIRENTDLISKLGAKDLSDLQLFEQVFPDQVDSGERKPTTWKWILSRIRDGNDTRPPRNLIDLVVMSREAQLRAESRAPRAFKAGTPLIGPESLRSAQKRLSAQRVEDTLLAEAGADLAAHIERFRGHKAEQNKETLTEILRTRDDRELSTVTRQLVEIGFLEELRSSWKIPMLYRDGLEITQGKAF